MVRARIVFLLGLAMYGIEAAAQSSGQPRVLGLGAYGAAVQDVRGFGWNPAGLTAMRDWDLTANAYFPTAGRESGLVFHGLGLGKRFLENEAVGIEFSPGAQMTFVLPPTLSLGGTNSPVSNERRFEYTEPVTLGYAHRFSPQVSAGVSFRYRIEKVTDTRISLVPGDSIALVPVTTENINTGRGIGADLSVLWRGGEVVSIGAVGRNILWLPQGSLPDSLSQYALPHSALAELSAGFRPFTSWLLTVGGSTNGTGAIGQEWLPGWGIAVRGAAYAGKGTGPFFYALSLGAGWSYDFLDLDAAYLYHTASGAGTGNLPEEDFDPGRISTLDVNPYGVDRISISVRAVFGNVRESMARIEAVDLKWAVYPSSFEMFAYRPIGTARVRNISDKPIRARVSFYVEKFMDAPTESQPVTIEPGAAEEVELTAIFSERVKALTSQTISEGKVLVSATLAETYDDRRQVSVLFRGRNEWDGSAESLRFFVKPDDPDVLRTTRDILLQNSAALTLAGPSMEPFVKARTILNGFAGKLVYVADPKLTTDYVQYPAETLKLQGGDCDDMTVCFSSLLGSVGISTAFVDVVPPDAPDKSHIYLLFDTGLDPRYGSSISDNPKRYVVRRARNGQETIWVPVETTLIRKGFDEAWSAGSQEYFDDVEISLGRAKGWVRILDVN